MSRAAYAASIPVAHVSGLIAAYDVAPALDPNTFGPN
jgi:hypothetical protein